MTDAKKPTDVPVSGPLVASLSESGDTTVSGLTDTSTTPRSAALSDPGSDPVEDEPSALAVAPFRPVADWLAPARAADALRRMEYGINGDVYADVLGARVGVDPSSLAFVLVQHRFVEVEQQLKSLRGSPALRTLVDALAKAGRMDRVRGWLATPASKAELDARVVALRQRARLDEVWRAIEPQFAGDAMFDWAEQRLHRENGIAKMLTEVEWRATIERVATHEVVLDGKPMHVRVQGHADWIRASIEEELQGTTLVSQRKVDLWTTDLSSTMGSATAQSFVEKTIGELGGRIGEVASANPLMNVRGRAVASPDALVSLCASDAEARADVRDKLKGGKLSVVLENWIDGIADERERKRPKALYEVLTWAEQTWKTRDAEMGLRAFLWAAGEHRLNLGDESVTSVHELIGAVDARVARLTPLLKSGELELWVRYAVGDADLSEVAKASALQGEVGAWSFLWAAGETRLRLGRRVARTVEELCTALNDHEEARRSVRAAIADGLLRAWLEHAQDRPELVKVLDDNRKAPAEVTAWAIAYAGGLKELSVDDGVFVTSVADLVTWLQGRIHAFVDRFDVDFLGERLRHWLMARAPEVDCELLFKWPRAQLSKLIWNAGVHKIWLNDDVAVSSARELAEHLAKEPSAIGAAVAKVREQVPVLEGQWGVDVRTIRGPKAQLLHRAGGNTDSDGARFSTSAADHALLLSFLANDPPAFIRDLGASRDPRFRDAAVIRRLDPSRAISVGTESFADDSPDALAVAVLGAVDRSRLWVEIAAARLVMQELSMSLHARRAEDVASRLDAALAITSAPAEPFPGEKVTREGVLRAVFAFHEGPRPFRPDDEEAQSLEDVGLFFARHPGRWGDELVAIERRLWLERERRADLATMNLADFLFAVFPERSTSVIEVVRAAKEPSGLIDVEWKLKRSLTLTNAGAGRTYEHVEDSGSLAVHTAHLTAPRGSSAKQAAALEAQLIESVVARSGVEPTRISNVNDLGAHILAECKAADRRRRDEERAPSYAALPPPSFGALPRQPLAPSIGLHLGRAAIGALAGGVALALLRFLAGLGADDAVRVHGQLPASLDVALENESAVIVTGIGTLVLLPIAIILIVIAVRRSR